MKRLKDTRILNLFFITLLIVVAAAVACGAAPAKGKKETAKTQDAPLTPATYDPRISLAPLVDKVAPSVVNIRTKVTPKQMRGMYGPNELFEWFFGPQGPGQQMPRQMPQQMPQQRSLGSGFVIDKSGLVVTNNHVVAEADEIEVQLADERTFKATLVGSDERTDVALLRLDGVKGKLPTVSFGDSDELKVGDHVVAIGNPFGLDHTVTSGIVSAKERVIGAGPYDAFIQTDASINPGNSGGPLFNLNGEVVGINTAIAPQGQGIGFAIPSSLAESVIDALSSKGEVVRGWLGIAFQPLTQELAKAFGMTDKNGAVVANVNSDSPAEKGGMLSGDIILSVNGKKLKNAHSLPTTVAKIKPGSTVPVEVLRKGKKKTLKITIGKMPTDLQENAQSQPNSEKSKAQLGFSVETLNDQLRQRLGADNVDGVVVTSVNPGSAAAEVLRQGDIISEINREPVKSVSDFNQKAKGLKSGDDILIHVYRRGAWLYLVYRL